MKYLFFFCAVVSFTAYASQQYLYTASPDDFDALTRSCPAWVELGDKMLILGDGPDMLIPSCGSKQQVEAPLYLAMSKDRPVADYLSSAKIYAAYRCFAVFSADPSALQDILRTQSYLFRVQALEFGQTVVTRRAVRSQEKADPEIQAVLDGINKDIVRDTLQKLVDYATRHTFSTKAGTIANDMRAAFEALGYKSEVVEFTSSGRTGYSIIARKPGTGQKKILVTAHLDSTSSGDAARLAPGADDNGSGSAGVLTIARAVRDMKLNQNVEFILFMGEEQGLLGSRAYVAKLAEDGAIAGVLNMDMIGYYGNDPDTVMLESLRFADPLVQELKASAEQYAGMKTEISYNAWGSDHEPFLSRNIPAVLTIENEWDSNPGYHNPKDTMENIRPDFMLKLIKINLATLLKLDQK
ncbi:MAG: M20/M25/M40 family metallo-hydrolase [Candidatus Wallbacteria bacterium]|nr:M20/M25/M40 family metallo-hydrolase [Candidatus Wallbacteria bacterium]